MTTIPLTILDNFLDNPNTVRDWGLSLNYTSAPNGEWPGKRSELLDKIHPVFFNNINRKVLSLFFENVNVINYKTILHFQQIENYQGKGWIHTDPNLFTFIIYLHESNPKIDCGTTLWSLNSNLVSPINSKEDIFNEDQRHSHHKNEYYPLEYQEKWHKNYTKEISIPDKYNRLLAFSSEQPHSANYFDNKLSSRLTLIGFVWDVSNANLPVIRNKQTLMF